MPHSITFNINFSNYMAFLEGPSLLEKLGFKKLTYAIEYCMLRCMHAA